MEENLLGHLLKANDPDAERAVEDQLTDPAAGRALTRLRAALAPLEADRDTIDPPADLWVRTLGLVAEHMIATEGPVTRPEEIRTDEIIRRAATIAIAPVPRLPDPITLSSSPTEAVLTPARRWNVVAVVGLSLSLLALIAPGIMHVRVKAQQMSCQNGMRQFFQAASGYTDHNDGYFPRVPAGQPAASAAVELQAAGYLRQDDRFTCPSAPPDAAAPVALATYAYTLGFLDENRQLRGLDRSPGFEQMPILADAPARQGNLAVPINHRRGQNVLFAGGNVRFCTTCNVGINGDDIFTNQAGFVSAGLSRDDTVLGRPDERP